MLIEIMSLLYIPLQGGFSFGCKVYSLFKLELYNALEYRKHIIIAYATMTFHKLQHACKAFE